MSNPRSKKFLIMDTETPDIMTEKIKTYRDKGDGGTALFRNLSAMNPTTTITTTTLPERPASECFRVAIGFPSNSRSLELASRRRWRCPASPPRCLRRKDLRHALRRDFGGIGFVHLSNGSCRHRLAEAQKQSLHRTAERSGNRGAGRFRRERRQAVLQTLQCRGNFFADDVGTRRPALGRV